MFRIMSIATLVMIAICFFIGASLAFADEGRIIDATGSMEQINDASRPVESQFDDNLAQNDEYDFGDYLNGTVTIPAVDAERIEEPELDRMITIEV